MLMEERNQGNKHLTSTDIKFQQKLWSIVAYKIDQLRCGWATVIVASLKRKSQHWRRRTWREDSLERTDLILLSPESMQGHVVSASGPLPVCATVCRPGGCLSSFFRLTVGSISFFPLPFSAALTGDWFGLDLQRWLLLPANPLLTVER